MTMKPQIKVYLSDIGNVLLRLKEADFFRRFNAASAGKGKEWFLSQMEDPESLFNGYERGKVEGRDLHACLKRHVKLRWDYAVFLKNWNDFFGPNPRMDRLIAALKPQVRLWALSNTNADHFAHFTAYPVFRHFEGMIGSHQLGLRKPEKAVFREALRVIGARPGEVFFIDDAPLNVEAARALGMRAFLYTFNDRELKEELSRLGMRFPKRL
jgi:putative hydrolase of the HAD superfamily